MAIYKLNKNMYDKIASATNEEAHLCVPLTDPANTDYQQFKTDVLAGAELQDADGNVMTQEEANNFINELS